MKAWNTIPEHQPLTHAAFPADVLARNLADRFAELRMEIFGQPTYADQSIDVARLWVLAVGIRPAAAHIERLLRERLASKLGAPATLHGYEAPA